MRKMSSFIDWSKVWLIALFFISGNFKKFAKIQIPGNPTITILRKYNIWKKNVGMLFQKRFNSLWISSLSKVAPVLFNNHYCFGSFYT